MNVVVLGAGVVGVTTAHALKEAGHHVTIIESETEPALGTSYANAGQLSAALSAPWAVPGLIRKALSWSVGRYPPLVIGGMPDAAMLSWLWQMLRYSNLKDYSASKRAMVQLGELNLERLRAMRQSIDLDYDGRRGGTIVLFRSERQCQGYRKDMDALHDLGVDARLLNLDELAILEPNLAIRKAEIVAAAHLPGDETGDCRRFTAALAQQLAQDDSVKFRFGTRILGLAHTGTTITGVETDKGTETADAVICCLGTASGPLLAPYGLRLPIYPLKGYSLTINADSDTVGPRSTVSDETYKIGVTYMGSRIRVGGTAELAGFDLSRPDKRYEGLFHVVRQLFPAIPDDAVRAAERWSGLRPMTPDGPPIIGRAVFSNLYLNTGHGTLGWTSACGSALLVSQLLAGGQPSIDPAPFSPERYH